MPVPNYLKEIACEPKDKHGHATFKVKCSCGSVRFHLQRSCLNKAERIQCKPYYDALDTLFKGGYASTCTKDEDGKVHYWKLLSSDMDGPREEVFLPECPAFAAIQVIKAECSECHREYILFDSRYHGYDARFSSPPSEEAKAYVPHFRERHDRGKAPVQVCVSVENEENLNAFRENTGIDCTDQDYTEAFSWITIYSINENGKKTKVFECETA